MAASAAAMAAQPLRRVPQISAPVLFNSTRIFSLYSRQLLLPAVSAALPAINLNIPAWLGGIWESILRAVPKKKTSHSKKRHRQMAGKALKDIKLCNCPACGQPKRQHVVCANCLSSIRSNVWGGSKTAAEQNEKRRAARAATKKGYR